eukprot:5259180-Pyramimonas_sp.AAC.1
MASNASWIACSVMERARASCIASCTMVSTPFGSTSASTPLDSTSVSEPSTAPTAAFFVFF